MNDTHNAANDAAILRAEVEHWKSHAEEAGQGFTRVCEDYARVSARNVRLAECLEAVREYVSDPGNWSALDGRRQTLLDIISTATSPAESGGAA